MERLRQTGAGQVGLPVAHPQQKQEYPVHVITWGYVHSSMKPMGLVLGSELRIAPALFS